MRVAAVLVLGSVLLATAAGAADAPKPTDAPKADAPLTPDGTIKLESGSASLVIGYRWGDGTLTYKGKDYPFKLAGVEIGSVGGGDAKAEGDVYYLKKVEDLNGTYTATSANLTVGKSGGGWQMVNENGVVLDLTRTTHGLKLTTGFDGIKITLK